MPYDDPDPTDPMTLHGVAVDVADDSAMRDMAECFIEEFARMGFLNERLMRMFQHPGYAGPHLAWRTLGETAIRGMIEAAWPTGGQVNDRGTLRVRPDGSISLPVLD